MLYIVYDEDHQPLRRFHTKVDVEWFLRDKPECTMKKIVEKRKKKEKKLTEYELAYQSAEPCLF